MHRTQFRILQISAFLLGQFPEIASGGETSQKRPAPDAPKTVPHARDAEDADRLAAAVVGHLKDAKGLPVANVIVFAARDADDRMSGFAVSGKEGQVELRLPASRHNFGIISSKYLVSRILHTGPSSFTIEMRLRPLPAERENPLAKQVVVVGQARVLRGRVLDQSGTELGGVEIEVLRRDGSLAAATLSGPRGDFAIGLLGGRFHLRALAPALRLARSVQAGNRIDLVMEIDASLQQVSLADGHVLKFRLDRSSDPEIFPPAPVRAWLCFSYGIVVRSRVPTLAERRRIQKYWYLELLRNPPPNPAKALSWGRSCVPEADEMASSRVGSGSLSSPLIEQLGDATLPAVIFAPSRQRPP